MRIRKIDVLQLLNVLSDVYNSGVNYIDIIGKKGEDEDTLGIQFLRDYIDPEYADNFKEIEEAEEKIETRNINLSDEDLNQLI
jgi:hypothetical protein